jgi:sugar phosphate permease
MVSVDNVNYRWVILSVIFLCQFILAVAPTGWGPLAPFLKKLMSLSNTQIGVISSTFSITATLSAFPAGILIDRLGVKKCLLAWLGITGFPLLFMTFFRHNYFVFLIMVAVAGLGYSIGNPVASKGVFIWFDRKIRGTVFGIRQSAVNFGGATMGLLLVYLSERIGPFSALRMVFWMIMGVMVLTFFFYREPKTDGHASGGNEPTDMRLSRMSFGRLLRNRELLTICSVAGTLGIAQGVTTTFFLIYVHESLGYPLLVAGSLFTMLMIGGAAGRIFWGVVSDLFFRGSRRRVLIIISVIAVVSVTILALWPATWPRWIFLPVVIALGTSSWGWNALVFALVAETSEGTKTATSVGLATAFGWFGISLGPLGFGTVTDHWGYFYAWIFLAICCMLSLFFCCLTPTSETSSTEMPRL